MMTYSMACDDGHAPEVLTVEAVDYDEAMTLMMAKSKSHLDTQHSDMPNMTEEQAKAFISSHMVRA